jgi:hypothetical protein
MNIFSKISTWFKDTFFPKLKTFLKAVFTSAVSIAVASIKDTVQEVVNELNFENLTNAEKRNEAYKRVVAKLKEEGKEVGENIIRMTIEMAVAALKNEVPPGA